MVCYSILIVTLDFISEWIVVVVCGQEAVEDNGSADTTEDLKMEVSSPPMIEDPNLMNKSFGGEDDLEIEDRQYYRPRPGRYRPYSANYRPYSYNRPYNRPYYGGKK